MELARWLVGQATHCLRFWTSVTCLRPLPAQRLLDRDGQQATHSPEFLDFGVFLQATFFFSFAGVAGKKTQHWLFQKAIELLLIRGQKDNPSCKQQLHSQLNSQSSHCLPDVRSSFAVLSRGPPTANNVWIMIRQARGVKQ